MNKTLCLIAWMLLAVAAPAAPISFPNHNFSVEFPEGWSAITPVPKPMLAAYQNADGTKKMVLLVQPLVGAQRALTNAEFMKGLKDGMARQGMALDSEKLGTIEGLPSVAVTGHLPGGLTMTAFVVGANEKMYMMQAVLGPGLNALKDPEVQSVVQSFKFLTPVPPSPAPSDEDSMAFRIGFVVGVVLILVIVVVGLVFVIKHAKSVRPKA